MNIKRCSKIIYKSNEYKICKYLNTLYESENELFRIQSSLDGNVIDISTGTTWLGANASKVEYSTNNDGTWRTLSGVTSITLNKNDKLYLKSSTGIGKNSLSDLPLIKSSKTFSVFGNLDYIIPIVESYSLNNFFIGTKVEKVDLKMNVKLDLNEYGFYRMFKNCTSLSSCYFDADTLDLGNLNNISTFIPGDYCFCEMFYGCTSLNSTMPESESEAFIFVGDLSIGAHQCDSMYYGCTNMIYPSLYLFSIIDLDPKNIADYAYYRTFYNCNKLISVGAAFIHNGAVTPESGDTVGNYSYAEMFYNCSSLNAYGLMGEDVEKFHLCPGGSYGYYRMFYGCTSLDSVDFIYTFSSIGDNGCNSMFMNCTSLKNTIHLSSNSIGNYAYRSMFEGCTSLETVTNNFKPQVVSTGGCYRMFANCTSLVNSNATLVAPDYTYSYYQMFYNCKSLTGINNFYHNNLNTNFWLDFWWSPYSCYGMFEGCVSLKRAPDLNGYLIQDHGCERMFYGCSSLNYLYCKALPGEIEWGTVLGQTIPTGYHATSGTSNWVVGVPSGGNFYYRDNTGFLWNRLGSGSGIPSGWTTHGI